MIERLCVIGVGLIGGSFALALKHAGQVKHVVGCGRNEANLQRAIELGVIDEYQLDPAVAVQQADVVFIATPLGAMEKVFAAIKNTVPAHAIITDAGSSKQSVIAAARAVWGELPVNFVPAHPIAGRENSGVEAAVVALFNAHRVILTPVASTNPQAVATLSALWVAVGAIVVQMDAEHHDEVLAATSHLPHVLAYALVDMLAKMDDRREIFTYAAGGFRDFTRIAASDPVMWRDICLGNQEDILVLLDQFIDDLARLRQKVAGKDATGLLQIFQRARAAKLRTLDDSRKDQQ